MNCKYNANNKPVQGGTNRGQSKRHTGNTRLLEQQCSLSIKGTRPGSCDARAHNPGQRKRHSNCQSKTIGKFEPGSVEP